MSNKCDKDKSELYCSTVAKSISNIIRFSLDEEFRLESFKIFRTQSTKETEEKIHENLMGILKNKKSRVLTDETETQTENIEKSDFETNSTSTSQETNTPSTSTQDSDSQSLFSPVNFYKRNWLKISSEKYKENFKKRKTRYFSQPTSFSTTNTETFKSFIQTPDYTTSNWDFSFNNSLSQNSFKNSQEYEDTIHF